MMRFLTRKYGSHAERFSNLLFSAPLREIFSCRMEFRLWRGMSFCIALLAIFMSASAQEQAPLPPYVRLPENASWSMKRVEAAAPAGQEAAPKKPSGGWSLIEIVQYGSSRHGLEHFTNGKTWEWWVREKIIFRKDATGSGIVIDGVDPAVPGSLEMALASSGFPGLQWLTAKYYRGKVRLGKRECHHFAAEIEPIDTEEFSSPGGSAEAWIDVETALPVRIRIDEKVFDVTFSDPPAAPLVLPPEAQAKLDEIKTLQKRAARIEQGGRR